MEMHHSKLHTIVQENDHLNSAVEENNAFVKALNTTINNLQSQLNTAEIELVKSKEEKKTS